MYKIIKTQKINQNLNLKFIQNQILKLLLVFWILFLDQILIMIMISNLIYRLRNNKKKSIFNHLIKLMELSKKYVLPVFMSILNKRIIL
jgi:hypothetical protein